MGTRVTLAHGITLVSLGGGNPPPDACGCTASLSYLGRWKSALNDISENGVDSHVRQNAVRCQRRCQLLQGYFCGLLGEVNGVIRLRPLAGRALTGKLCEDGKLLKTGCRRGILVDGGGIDKSPEGS